MAEGGEHPRLYKDILSSQWPIIYCAEYNIGFLGLEKLHPFDAGKWGNIYNFLKNEGMLTSENIVTPDEASEDDLKVVHSQKYLDSLRWSSTVARITEIPPVFFLPNFIVQNRVLKPFRYQTGGTILAGKLAMERGWAMNIGGGFHHCRADSGGGFCAYADISLCIHFLFRHRKGVKKVMIVDLDAHQGNGYARDFMDDERVYIMDMFNGSIYPRDMAARRAINRKVVLHNMMADEEYLPLVDSHLQGAMNEFDADVIVYNAGTDVLEGDPLGNLSITAKGIIARDEAVFRAANARNIPIIMLTSGGYQRTTARIIADSVLNLRSKGLISEAQARAVDAGDRVPNKL